ncbi:emp24/gp25L/p24 family/GOLD-domain-containing protein [Sphaerosporella brunnea]|uniref:Emp24/gp25L/p24 family/GOLD-domain-containing protein n=1 Tax=Sphaerosporella brunnea TaxID=1250544 RepID=A0A5J5ER02_9PEZI|nr:emp24/gp25L/p24 family/GOLD-domain-containing protein [Sphaerosporella brunnea]
MQLRLSTLLLAASFAAKQVAGLYFYIDGTSPKCFFEELPQDTLVVGQYKAEEYQSHTNQYSDNNQLALLITVDETFDNDHRVVNQKGSNKGRFTFTAGSAGEHRICFWASHQSNSGWFSSHPNGVRLHLDLAIGETTKIESRDKEKLQDIEQRVRDLSGRLQDIRREQVFQREREAEFRDQSELTNSRVVRWTLVQLLVLGATCAWQLSHLRAFFIKQKLT